MNVVIVPPPLPRPALSVNSRDQLSVCSYWEQCILGLCQKSPQGGFPSQPHPVSITPTTLRSHQDQMPTIPGVLSQSMLGGTMAGLQPIGSTLLTACNLLISLAAPPPDQESGTATTGQQSPPLPSLIPALMRSHHSPRSPLSRLACYIPIVFSASVGLQGYNTEKCSHWHLLISH